MLKFLSTFSLFNCAKLIPPTIENKFKSRIHYDTLMNISKTN